LAVDLARVDSEFAAGFDVAFTAHHAVQYNVIHIRVQIQRIANPHRLYQKA